MNALERNAEYAHRGQRITMTIPPKLTLRAGDRIEITFDAPHSWRMPATVITVQPLRPFLIAAIEPGAAVSHPARWFIVSEVAQAIDAVPQFDLFAAV